MRTNVTKLANVRSCLAITYCYKNHLFRGVATYRPFVNGVYLEVSDNSISLSTANAEKAGF